MNAIRKRSEKDKNAKFDDLYSLLYKEDLVFKAIDKLKTNKGSGTAGVDSATFDKYNNKAIQELIQKLKNKTYNFLPVKKKKRLYFPKPGKTTLRPIGIPSFQDRIVQEMIRTILEQIYEPIFEKVHNNVNAGFRTGKGCHDSIHRLLQQVKGYDWCIEGDIKGAYDNIRHNKLLEILGEKIIDKTFLKLIRNGLESGLVHQGQFHHTILGTPQGGIASPILFNIYMSKLDEYVSNDLAKLVLNKNETENRLAKPVTNSYNKIRSEIRKIERNNLGKDTEQEQELIERHRFLEIKKFSVPYLDKKKTLIRMVYARYADDWVLFTNGSEEYATHLKDKINEFLQNQLGLELNQDKTKITNVKTTRVKFLGYSLCTFGTNRKVMGVTGKSGAVNNKRTTGINLVAGMDQDRLDNRLILKGFITKDGKGEIKAKRKPEWTVFQDHEIIQMFNYVIRGISNYYMLISQVSHINHYCYLLYYSCAHTLANKHNASLRQIFTKYGHPIQAKKPERNKAEKEKESEKEADSVKLLDYLQVKEIMLKQKQAFVIRNNDKDKANKAKNENSIDTTTNDPLELRANW